jgi:hypothetical protein
MGPGLRLGLHPPEMADKAGALFRELALGIPEGHTIIRHKQHLISGVVFYACARGFLKAL